MRSIVMALRNHPAVNIGPDTRALDAFENAARYEEEVGREEGRWGNEKRGKEREEKGEKREKRAKGGGERLINSSGPPQ